jgi:hypothetical protein
MTFDLETLYALLPAIYRIRDTRADGAPGPLLGLLGVLADEVAVLEENLDQLYDDQFIETCAEWVIPYIGDLLAARGVHGAGLAAASQRAYVANTIGYRRRKGTAAMLEQLAHDLTGWDARVVEFYALLATTQYLNHLRLGNTVTPDLRDWEALERVGSPFDTLTRTADVRKIETGRGRYNIPDVGIFVWRLRPFALTDVPAFRVDDRRYLVSPLGADAQLYTLPAPRPPVMDRLATPLEVPDPISRRLLDQYLDAGYYGPGASLFLSVNGTPVPDPRTSSAASAQIRVCDLSDLTGPGGSVTGWAHADGDRIAIDPVLGRIAVPPELAGADLTVTWHRAFSAPMGGGEYARSATFTTPPVLPTLRVSGSPGAVVDAASIQEALDALQGASGAIEIADSGRYEDPLTLALSPGQNVEIRAADGRCPVLALGGDLWVSGDAAALSLNGLWISGGAIRVSGEMASVHIVHTTLVPGQGLTPSGAPASPPSASVVVTGTRGHQVQLGIDHSIVGPLRLPAELSVLSVMDSIVDSPARSGAAQRRPCLVSGELPDPPALSSGARFLQVTIGGEGPWQAALARTPASVQDAASLLQDALRAAAASPAFTQTQVVAAGNRLVVLAGVPAPVQVQASGAEDAAGPLGLLAPEARPAIAILGGVVPQPLHLQSSGPPQVAVGWNGSRSVAALDGFPTTMADAAAALQAAVRAVAPAPAVASALVATLNDRLLVIPGPRAIGFVLDAAAADATTLGDLGLDAARPAIAGDDGGDTPAPVATIERCTVIGDTVVDELDLVSDSIFAGALRSNRRQAGCVRFSYVPEGSLTPPRFACHPASSDCRPIRPAFTSLQFGQPGYCQLASRCPAEIARGASDGAEMGAFHDLRQPQREDDLSGALGEYLRFSLEAGIFHVT